MDFYLLFNFNNYFNRKMKRLTTLAAYKAAANSWTSVSGVTNFTLADGVDTSWVMNLTPQTVDINKEAPDYLLVCDTDGSILQRWFVTDTNYLRNGQYQITLHRDVVAEAWTDLTDAPIFVEKAIVAQNDPMIFNKEQMTFNQVKTHEYPLTDEVGVQWIVGYMSPTANGTKTFDPDVNADYEYTSIEEYPYYAYSTGSKMYVDLTNKTYWLYADNSGGATGYQVAFNEDLSSVASVGGNGSSLIVYNSDVKNSFAAMMKTNAGAVTTGLKSYLGVQTDVLTAENNKTIKVGSNYYRVTVNARQYENVSRTFVNMSHTAAYNGFETAKNAANTRFQFIRSDDTGNNLSYEYMVTKVYLTISINLIPSANTITYTVPGAKSILRDQPYAMFAMPYGYTTISGISGFGAKDFKEISMMVAKNISEEFGGTAPELYDLQLLPYCPIREYYDEDIGLLSVSGKISGVDYSMITQNDTNIGIIFWCTKSKASFVTSAGAITVNDYKIENETKVYRLCSPNFNGQFEFSAAANGGVTGYNVDFTYKPYNPYIHVSPKFGRLYGSDFGDARGLICGGKFDLPQTTDAWATYERSNSNYNAIFDRQITNLEVQQDVARTNDIATTIAGSLQGAGTGAAMGSMFGPSGAIIGGIAGGAASAIGGAVDYSNNEKLRQETLSYTQDMYGFQLGNIQAMPDGLTSVGSLTNNYKQFPFIEVYEATDAEVEALKNKIRYNGMTVGRIDTISSIGANAWTYSNGWNYFKGRLIRLDISEDWHFINTIKNELNMGIYLQEAT